MPTSPPLAIPRSKSAPRDISSSRSDLSSDISSKPVGLKSSITCWPEVFVKGRRKKSNLTVENLHEFNRKNNALVEVRCSPYYKGLTDFSLVIEKEKQARSNLSPGRESHAGSLTSSGTARSSLVVKMQEWGSSFFPSKLHEETSWTKPSHEAQSTVVPMPSSSSKVTESGAQQLAKKFAYDSKNNLRQAIRSFEATWHFNGCPDSLTEDQVIKNGWEDKIADIAKKVIEEQSPKQLFKIRGEIENLLEHNVDAEFIFQALKEELTKILPEQLQPQLVHFYDEYQRKNKYFAYKDREERPVKSQHDQTKNVQQFIRIEEFIARFMSCYKSVARMNKEV